MKDAIVIRVKETDEFIAMSMKTDVSITERTKYSILINLMKALKMSVDWMDKEQVGVFFLKMLLASLGNAAEEVNED